MNKKPGRLFQPSMAMYFIVMGCFAVASVLLQQYILAAVEATVTIVFFIVYRLHRKKQKKELQAFVHAASGVPERANRNDTAFPTVLARLGDGTVLWTNEQFVSISGYKDQMRDQNLTEIMPGFTTDWLASGKNEYPYDVTLQGRRYRVYGITTRAEDSDGTMLGVLYFTDLTELYQVRDEYIRSRPVVSMILVDNYEELTKNLSDSAVSALNARLNATITEWAEGYQGLLRRLERNRFLFVFEKRELNKAIEEKFALIEQIHQVTSPSGVAASISFGLGVDGSTYEECLKFALLSIDMALSRGGDQAVIKDRLTFSFYGGHTKEADHRSKVRSRVMANSLMELIGQSSQVFVMGHKNADLDAVGAAMGICSLCRKKEKKAYIVLDVEHNAAQQLVDEIREVPEYKDCIISGQDALLMCDGHSTLVVVDTNRPNQVECQPLLEAVHKVCIIDHHRRAADYIDPVVVNFHEPYASSASELVTELLQYTLEKADVLPIEAKSLMAGIFLDTKSFNIRTGERTFESAAFLQRLGADTMEVKRLLQNDFQDTISKYQIIKSSRLYRKEIAIAALNSGTNRILAAQAADEMLNISGITASFVLYPQDNEVIVSARSIGDCNVQLVLEPLGGGGNSAAAGAQVKNSTVKEVLDRLVASIDKFYEE